MQAHQWKPISRQVLSALTKLEDSKVLEDYISSTRSHMLVRTDRRLESLKILRMNEK